MNKIRNEIRSVVSLEPREVFVAMIPTVRNNSEISTSWAVEFPPESIATQWAGVSEIELARCSGGALLAGTGEATSPLNPGE